jgi:peroxiredoxin
MAVDVGDLAPDFELPSHHGGGKKVRLSDFRGHKHVFIAFYPLAWTPV